MSQPREPFAGGDQQYLREQQYATTAKLDARSRLHHRYGTAEIGWFSWQVSQLSWPAGPVLEVGCGSGSLWCEGRPPVAGAVTLSDLSVGMVDAASAAVGGVGYDVTGMVADAQNLPVSSHSHAVVIANHMLYHVPDPAAAVTELGRVLRDDGVALAATNGQNHMRGLREMDHEVFGSRMVDRTVEVFGIESGRLILDGVFADVDLRRYRDTLLVTDPDDAFEYLTSLPPGEDADPRQREALRAEIDRRFDLGGGVLSVEKDVGLFLCRLPRR